MDYNSLEKMWDQQAVSGSALDADLVIAQMKREVRHAQRRIRGGIVLASSVLALGWVVLLAAYLTGIKRPSAVGLLGELVGFALYVAFFARAAQAARAVRAAETAMGGTLRVASAAALRTIELQIANARLAAVTIPMVVAISAWLFGAKYLAGDMRGLGAAFGSAFIATLGAAIGGAFWHRYHTQLIPRRAELREALRALEGE